MHVFGINYAQSGWPGLVTRPPMLSDLADVVTGLCKWRAHNSGRYRYAYVSADAPESEFGFALPYPFGDWLWDDGYYNRVRREQTRDRLNCLRVLWLWSRAKAYHSIWYRHQSYTNLVSLFEGLTGGLTTMHGPDKPLRYREHSARSAVVDIERLCAVRRPDNQASYVCAGLALPRLYYTLDEQERYVLHYSESVPLSLCYDSLRAWRQACRRLRRAGHISGFEPIYRPQLSPDPVPRAAAVPCQDFGQRIVRRRADDSC